MGLKFHLVALNDWQCHNLVDKNYSMMQIIAVSERSKLNGFLSDKHDACWRQRIVQLRGPVDPLVTLTLL